MNTKTKEGARNKGNPYFLRVPWNKGGLVNTGPGLRLQTKASKAEKTCVLQQRHGATKVFFSPHSLYRFIVFTHGVLVGGKMYLFLAILQLTNYIAS